MWRSGTVVSQVCDNLNVEEMLEMSKLVEFSSSCEIGEYQFCVDIGDAGVNCS